jgi:DNA repair ATPase RecN
MAGLNTKEVIEKYQNIYEEDQKKIKDLEEELKEYIYLLGKKEKEIEVKEKEINQLKEKREDFCNKLQNIRVRIADWNVEEIAGAIKILKELENVLEK